MQEASYWEPCKDSSVKCNLCPRNCTIQDGQLGFCRVRKNDGGKLYSTVYGKAAGMNVDPIEKKPLFHFYPKERIFSLGTVGCNLRCKFCQNHESSQVPTGQLFEREVSPEKVIQLAKDNNCNMIASTYNEPTVFFEYMRDYAKLARQQRMKHVIVSNGFIEQEPLKELIQWTDAANIDLKCFSNRFYGSVSSGWLQPVLDTIKALHESDVWLELTTLIIPSLNDSFTELNKLAKWVADNLGHDVPLHFSAFHPDYQLQEIPSTPENTMEAAYRIAKDHGLNYVYLGNIISDKDSTYCSRCKRVLIDRTGFMIHKVNIRGNQCRFCKKEVPGVFNE